MYLTELAQPEVGGLVFIRITSHKALEGMPCPNAGDVGPPPLDGVESLVLGLQPIYPPESRSLFHRQQRLVVA